jgi:hypothetical protein
VCALCMIHELGGSSDVAPATPSVVAPASPPPHAHTIIHTRPLLLPRQPHPSPSSAMLLTLAPLPQVFWIRTWTKPASKGASGAAANVCACFVCREVNLTHLWRRARFRCTRWRRVSWCPPASPPSSLHLSVSARQIALGEVCALELGIGKVLVSRHPPLRGWVFIGEGFDLRQ